MIAVCRNYGVGFTPVFPIAKGLLSGKYRSGIGGNPSGAGRVGDIPEDVLEKVEKLAKLADSRNITRGIFPCLAYASARGYGADPWRKDDGIFGIGGCGLVK